MYFYLGIIALTIVGGSHGQQTCSTAAGTLGTCVNIAQCAPLLDLLSRSDPSGSSERAIILKKSQCGLDGTTPKVCCPSGTQKPQTPQRSGAIPDPPNVSNHPKLGLVNTQFCGPVTEPKIIQGQKTLVSEFPWMALIGYKENGQGPDFQCGGSVITKRYVLTAAHCVTRLRRGLELSGPVRLGEHDLNKEVDCDEDDGATVYCADKYQDFSIESTHPHSDYQPEGSANDIALIRIDRDADFRPLNVRPICLPIGSIATLKSSQAIVTGWGRTEFGTRSQDLLKVPLAIVANDDCAKIFAINQISIGHKQLCAGGNTKDSCAGDSGGPLQYPGIIDGVPKYVQYGIVSFGTKKCGVLGYPGVYTRVVYYMDWILDIIKDNPQTLSRSGVIPDPPDVSNHPRLGLINTELCGPALHQRSIGGQKTDVTEFPWMALIGYIENGRGPYFQCGGSLINKRYVLTAAHCVTALPSGLELSGPVRLGEHDLDKEIDCDNEEGPSADCEYKYQDFSIESIHPHSGFQLKTNVNDIALIRINRDTDFQPSHVRPICLPIESMATLKSPRATVTGWGRTEFGNRSKDLLQVVLTIVPNDDCAKIFAINEISIWHKQLCAGGNTTDSCAGDSRGPLQHPGIINGEPKYIQYGIVSFGKNKCGEPGYPGVYTSVIYYMDWILDTIED